MSSYLGGFPPGIPRRLISEWVPRRATVVDPFCGSGTTLLEARRLGRPSIGIDLNPLAVSLARAKIQSVDKRDLDFRLTELARGFRGESDFDDSPEELAPIFHPRTLAQLCYLRAALDDSQPEDVFLRGCLLGIMHGKGRRDGTTAYLSVDMPNTFSMSPNYVRKFVRENGLQAPPVDVFLKLRERVAWLLRNGPSPVGPSSRVLLGDSANLNSVLRGIGVRSVGAIVTSPPYLGILRYGAFNWIRLWFLGLDQHEVDQRLDTTDSLDVYLSFMVTFFGAAARVLKPGGVLVLVIGDVVENGQKLVLAERIWDEIGALVPFELVSVETDAYDQTTKTTRIWGDERRGQASPVDRFLVVKRIASRDKQRASAAVPIGLRVSTLDRARRT